MSQCNFVKKLYKNLQKKFKFIFVHLQFSNLVKPKMFKTVEFLNNVNQFLRL